VNKNCKVITTCFIGREVREEDDIVVDPPDLFLHTQYFPDPDKVLELVALIRELEVKVDPGVESDTIIVNNDVGWEKGNKFLESIHNTDIFAGKLKVITRENFGRSFGGYNRAYEIFRNQYDFWTFTEDDVFVIGDKYFKLCIDTFRKTPKAGFVAILGLSEEIRLHAHGGVGTTHVSVLDEVYKKWGKLPHCERHQPQSYEDIIRYGEVAFTNAIKTLGYALVNVESDCPLHVFAHDHIKQTRSVDHVGFRSPAPQQSLSQRCDIVLPAGNVSQVAKSVPFGIKAFIKRLAPLIVLDLYRAWRRRRRDPLTG